MHLTAYNELITADVRTLLCGPYLKAALVPAVGTVCFAK